VGKNNLHRFLRLISPFRKRYEIGPWLLRVTNRKSYILDRPVRATFDDLKWPWKGTRGSNYFGGPLHVYMYARAV